MKFRPTILNIPAILLLGFLIIYTAFNYSTLVEGEGWGLLAIIPLLIIGFSALLLDWLISALIKAKRDQNIARSIALIGYAILWYSILYYYV